MLAFLAGCGGGGGGGASSTAPSENTTVGIAAPTSAPTVKPAATPTPTAKPTAVATATAKPGTSPTPTPTGSPTSEPAATPTPTPTPTTLPPAAGLAVPAGFSIGVLAKISGARELAFLPNGDLLVGTEGTAIEIVPAADTAGVPGAPTTFYTAAEAPAAGVAFGPDGNVYFGTQHGIWRLPYHLGDRSEPAGSAVQLGAIRPSTVREDHVTTSIAVSATTVYASVGSSSNAQWPEIDATRATIQQIPLGTTTMSARAVQLRNGIGLTIDPASGHLWVAGAGQDSLPYGHPYEYADDVDAHPGVADYGWPFCEENHVQYTAGMNCAQQAVPLVEFPAYATHVGLAFYPAAQSGAYAFPAAYRGGLFVTSHGSWHCCPATLPNVAFVPMNGDVPATAVNWNDPTVQSRQFVSGYGSGANASYSGRPTGIAVGPQGSLFVADDQTGNIIRIRHN
jgi:glucose/arabinose dehydrogenase